MKKGVQVYYMHENDVKESRKGKGNVIHIYEKPKRLINFSDIRDTGFQATTKKELCDSLMHAKEIIECLFKRHVIEQQKVKILVDRCRQHNVPIEISQQDLLDYEIDVDRLTRKGAEEIIKENLGMSLSETVRRSIEEQIGFKVEKYIKEDLELYQAKRKLDVYNYQLDLIKKDTKIETKERLRLMEMTLNKIEIVMSAIKGRQKQLEFNHEHNKNKKQGVPKINIGNIIRGVNDNDKQEE
jgi:hypothetical protein